MPEKPVIKSSTLVTPDVYADGKVSGGMFGASRRLKHQIVKTARKDEKEILTNPKLNPAGKATLEQTASSNVSMGGFGDQRITTVNTSYGADPGHAARLRGKRARSWDTIAKGQK